MFLTVTIAYKTKALNYYRSQCIVSSPRSESENEEIFNFFWMLSQSSFVAEFCVTSGSYSAMPKDFGWACDKWVEKLSYLHD